MKNNAGEVEMSSFIETGYTTLQPKEVWHFPGKEFVVLSIKFRYVLTTGWYYFCISYFYSMEIFLANYSLLEDSRQFELEN